jgi:AICAR transformylase/IMP cyclohydrolase PurH
MRLRYGINPHQEFATATPVRDDEWPIRIVHGEPSYINLLDALNSWQLVTELKEATGKPAGASFKHVSPAGAAVAGPLDHADVANLALEAADLSDTAMAYVRARGADPKSSYGDFAAVSEPVDASTARVLRGVVSHGCIAPSFELGVVEVLQKKMGGNYLLIEADPSYLPPNREVREVFGLRLVQDRNNRAITRDDLRDVVCGDLTTDSAARDIIVGLITLKYTQSNSVGYVLDGQMVGIGAGQQSRIDCTKLAGAKVDTWHLMKHPKVLTLSFNDGVLLQDRINWKMRFIEGDMTSSERAAFQAALVGKVEPITTEERKEFLKNLRGLSFVSDGLIPFADNIEQAMRHGVEFVAEPGGSLRSNEVETACREYGITLVKTDLRLFHH